jgi:Flp pilus assembly protein TadB
VVGAADADEAAWRAAINDDDPAGLQEDWPVHIRWIDGTAITIVLGILMLIEATGLTRLWIGGLVAAAVLAIIGEYAKHSESRARVRRYVGVLEAEEERAIRQGRKPAAAPDLSNHKRPRVLGTPVLILLTGMVAWIFLVELPTGTLTLIGALFAGLCALLCWPAWKKKQRARQAMRAAVPAARAERAATAKRGPVDNPKGKARGKR